MPRVATVFVAPKEATCPLKPLLLTPTNTMHRFVSEPVQPGLSAAAASATRPKNNYVLGAKKQLAARAVGVCLRPPCGLLKRPIHSNGIYYCVTAT